jgi:hypothetical protein
MAAFSCVMGQVGVGEAVNPREERGAEHCGACNVEMGRGMVCSCLVVWCHEIVL